ncbi:syntaxin-17-like [Babylonia areolata]|uniref:syntaxin-17-like n=1 Tax=Babylonia areolata TaxID=304850 RepID=UPI003FD0D66E
MSLQTLRRTASEEDLIQGGRKGPVNVQKFPLGRLKLAIQKFQKVLQIDLERLQKHRTNMDRYIVIEDWKGLHKEQINASRTVQQVKATLRDLERTRAQVYDEELDQFDEQVQDIKLKAVAAVESFLRVSQADQLHPDIIYAPSDHTDASRESTSLPPEFAPPPPMMGLQSIQELHVVPENSQAAASWESLQQDMEELNELVHQFADTVKQQGEAVDRIEDNIDQAGENVREGTLNLGKASKYKVAMFPLVGALIGGIVAGPVGLVAGAKIGGVAGALGGGVAGFAGGRYLKSRHSRAVSLEMQNLSERSDSSTPPTPPPQRSTSNPELSSPLSGDEADSSPTRSSFRHFFGWGQRKSHSESED